MPDPLLDATMSAIARRERVLKAADAYIRLVEMKPRKASRVGPLSNKIHKALRDLSEAVWEWREKQ